MVDWMLAIVQVPPNPLKDVAGGAPTTSTVTPSRRPSRLKERVLKLEVVRCWSLSWSSRWLASVLAEPALGVHGGHGAGARGGDRLAVDVVLDVAGGVDALVGCPIKVVRVHAAPRII